MSPTDTPSAQSDGKIIPAPRFNVPVFQSGCASEEPASGSVATVAMRVRRSGALVFEYVPVCIDGKGPFPFILDTGASISVVDTALARTLQLAPSGSPQVGSGVNCVARIQPSQVARWSLGRVPLASQRVAVITIPLFGAENAPAGLLGSDVLSRFGSIRLDFRSQALRVEGGEGPPNEDHQIAGKPVPSAVDASLSQGDQYTAVPLSVVSRAGGVEATVDLRIRNTEQRFVLDTGSGRSSITDTLAKSIPFPSVGQREEVVSVGCMILARLVMSGPWSIGSTSLGPKPLLEVSLGATFSASGLLGSDELQTFGWIVVDYRAGELLLGE